MKEPFQVSRMGDMMGPTLKACSRSIVGCVVVLAVCVGFSARSSLASDDCQSAPMAGINWEGCDKTMLILNGSDLTGANLTGVNFSSTDLRNTNFDGANLEKATFVRASLADAIAKGVHFARIEAYRTDFSRIDASGAIFQNAELQRSNFRDSKLANADFTKADLGRSQFDGAEVGGSRFALANVARADFRSAKFDAPVNFDRAFFFLTRIEGVNLAAATGLVQWQVDMACGDDKTVLPAGIKKPKTWPCSFQQD
jgi:uncharacterized protein YjbI with pentapeptide repeats